MKIAFISESDSRNFQKITHLGPQMWLCIFLVLIPHPNIILWQMWLELGVQSAIFSRVRVTEILSEKMSALAGGIPSSRIFEGAGEEMEGRKRPMRGSRITTTLLE